MPTSLEMVSFTGRAFASGSMHPQLFHRMQTKGTLAAGKLREESPELLSWTDRSPKRKLYPCLHETFKGG